MAANQKRRLRVILESPYAGDVERNRLYALTALRDSLDRGEAPFATHLLYPQVLTTERLQGLNAGLEWIRVAEKSVVYVDYGITEGMRQGMDLAKKLGVPIEKRSLRESGKWPK